MRGRPLYLIPGFALVAGLAPVMAPAADPASTSPIAIELVREGFASFTNALHPDNRIGYRFHEHTPLVQGPVPQSDAEAGTDPAAVDRLVARMAKRPGCVQYRRRIAEKGWMPQTWTFYLAPAGDGIDLLLAVETGDKGLNRYYGVQQCFRMSGQTNAAWRREIACTPAFSEYDLWARQKGQRQRTSLTYVFRGTKPFALPATTETLGARTPFGTLSDAERLGCDVASVRGRLPEQDRMPEVMQRIGPYEARMVALIDHGLIARADVDGQWVCGIYWHGTSHVTDHHPADCLHAIVNIGNVPPHSRRAIRGKIYWFRGTLRQLLERCQRDFPAENL